MYILSKYIPIVFHHSLPSSFLLPIFIHSQRDNNYIGRRKGREIEDEDRKGSKTKTREEREVVRIELEYLG